MVNPSDPCLKFDQVKKKRKNRNRLSCDQSQSGLIDVVILTVVICACGFLLYPYVRILGQTSVEVMEIVIEEVVRAPLVFGCLGLSIFFAVMALVAITVCTDNRCGKVGCRGLRKPAEFHIQLESVNKTTTTSALKKGLSGLPRDRHRELEAELKKMAPRLMAGRCWCSRAGVDAPSAEWRLRGQGNLESWT